QVKIAEQRAAASQHDPLIDDVGGELGSGVLERNLDRLDNRAYRFGEAFGDLALTDHDFFGHPVHQVAPLDLHYPPLAVLGHTGGTDVLLDPLSAALANEEIMVAADIGDDCFVHLVAPDPHRAAIDDAAQGEHRYLRRSTSDINDHRSCGLGHRKAGTDRCGHWLLDQEDPP